MNCFYLIKTINLINNANPSRSLMRSKNDSLRGASKRRSPPKIELRFPIFLSKCFPVECMYTRQNSWHFDNATPRYGNQVIAF